MSGRARASATRASDREEKRREEEEKEMASATTWKQDEIDSLKADYQELKQIQNDAVTPYNPTPGTGRTGYMAIPPNNYPFYTKEEKYIPVVQPDGGQLSGMQSQQRNATCICLFVLKNKSTPMMMMMILVSIDLFLFRCFSQTTHEGKAFTGTKPMH